MDSEFPRHSIPVLFGSSSSAFRRHAVAGCKTSWAVACDSDIVDKKFAELINDEQCEDDWELHAIAKFQLVDTINKLTLRGKLPSQLFCWHALGGGNHDGSWSSNVRIYKVNEICFWMPAATGALFASTVTNSVTASPSSFHGNNCDTSTCFDYFKVTMIRKRPRS